MSEVNTYRPQATGVQHHFYITGAIKEAEHYLDLIECLYSATPSDEIILHLNTPGGDLDTTIQIINGIRSCAGVVVGIADGIVASAGTVIFFSCHSLVVQPFSYFMFHDGSEAAMGKINDNLAQVTFMSKFLANLFMEVYVPFFSKAEVTKILNGKDLWLTSDEIVERITKVVEAEEAE